MQEYHKIETLLDRDEKFKVIPNKWRLPEFEYLKDNEWEFTEKVDGTNIRVIWNPIDRIIDEGVMDAHLKYGGKTDNAQIPPFLIKRLNELFNADKMRELFPNEPVCLYGEGYGAKIQKGGGNYIPDGCDFILFDVKIDQWWLERQNIEGIATNLGIKIVPIIGRGTLISAINQVQQGIKSTFGNGLFNAEGIVVKPKVGLQNRSGHRIIGKIKTKDF